VVKTFVYTLFMQFSVYANILLNTCDKSAYARPKLLLISLRFYHINTTTSFPDRLWCPHSLLFCRYGNSSIPSSRITKTRSEAVLMRSTSSDIKNEWSHTSTLSTFCYHGEKQICFFIHFFLLILYPSEIQFFFNMVLCDSLIL
jgi:hypothetical protein